MTKILDKAMSILDLQLTLENIAHDDKRELSSYTDAEIIHEAKYVLSCFFEGGHGANDELIGEGGPEIQKAAKKQVAALKKLIASYQRKIA